MDCPDPLLKPQEINANRHRKARQHPPIFSAPHLVEMNSEPRFVGPFIIRTLHRQRQDVLVLRILESLPWQQTRDQLHTGAEICKFDPEIGGGICSTDRPTTSTYDPSTTAPVSQLQRNGYCQTWWSGARVPLSRTPLDHTSKQALSCCLGGGGEGSRAHSAVARVGGPEVATVCARRPRRGVPCVRFSRTSLQDPPQTTIPGGAEPNAVNPTSQMSRP